MNPQGVPFPEFQTGEGAHGAIGWWGRMAVDEVRKLIYIAGGAYQYNDTKRSGLIVISLEDGSLK